MKSPPAVLSGYRRIVLLGALTVFGPLWILLAYWGGFAGRDIRLSPLQAVVFGALSAGAAGVLASLFLANHTRLKQILRLRKRRIFLALLLALLTPVLLIGALPVIPLAAFFMAFGPSFEGVVSLLQEMGEVVIGVIVLAALWYGPVSFVMSGLQGKPMRIAVLALMWWGLYGLWALTIGLAPFTL